MGIMHFSDYKQSVILAYQRLRDKGDLPSNLKRPTPAKLKNECLFILADKDRNSEKDIDTLRSFFGPKKDLNEYSQAIKRFGTDKCKPLNNFLKKEEGNTDDKNIELLALLINFKPRPFIFGESTIEDIKTNQESETTHKPEEGKQDENKETSEISEIDKTEEESSNTQNTEPTGESGPSKIGRQGWFTSKKNITSIIIFTLATSGIYWVNGTYDVSNKAYICDRGTGKKYHLNSNCPFLKNCKNEFVQTTVVEAEKNGKTLCGFEHK